MTIFEGNIVRDTILPGKLRHSVSPILYMPANRIQNTLYECVNVTATYFGIILY